MYRDYPGGPYGSEWAINKRGEVPVLNDFNPAYPERVPCYLINGLIHRNNNNGFTLIEFVKSKDIKVNSLT